MIQAFRKPEGALGVGRYKEGQAVGAHPSLAWFSTDYLGRICVEKNKVEG